ncbi:MAG: sigma-70 family RNA polymerase sigma factor [Desulfobacteraceae bacterium]|nr:sigma-70 family RNA polymerase sigma factor [Desulfobacteraceae bacterium]
MNLDPHNAYLNHKFLQAKDPVNPLILQDEGATFFTEPTLNFTFLTKFQNTILQLFHFEGKSYKQIAKIVSGNKFKGLRCKTNTQAIKNQLKTARIKIRENIKFHRKS